MFWQNPVQWEPNQPNYTISLNKSVEIKIPTPQRTESESKNQQSMLSEGMGGLFRLLASAAK